MLQSCSIVLVPFPRILRGAGKTPAPPPPHCEFWIQNNGNQLCFNSAQLVLQFFSIVPAPITRGVVLLGTQPPPIANFRFEITGFNCAPIVLNCAAIFFNCTRPSFQLPGGWFSGLRPPLRISGSKQRESIVLRLCSIFLQFLSLVPAPFFMTQSFEVEVCGITFFLKIAALSLEIRNWFLQKIVPGPKTCKLGVQS